MITTTHTYQAVVNPTQLLKRAQSSNVTAFPDEFHELAEIALFGSIRRYLEILNMLDFGAADGINARRYKYKFLLQGHPFMVSVDFSNLANSIIRQLLRELIPC